MDLFPGPERSGKFRQALVSGARLALDQLFPRRCMGCRTLLDPGTVTRDPRPPATLSDPGADGYYHGLFSPFFCPDCRAGDWALSDGPRCPVCQGEMAPAALPGAVCSDCAAPDFPIDRVRAAGAYGHGLLDAVHLLKYSGRSALADPLGRLLCLALETHFSGQVPDLVIPIPLHRSRLVRRGFNQAFLLARAMERQFRRQCGHRPPWRVVHSHLVRRRKTASQTGFNRQERRRNLHNAFQVPRPARVQNQAILLIDDVYTTGATCREAARALHCCGVASVDVLVVARA